MTRREKVSSKLNGTPFSGVEGYLNKHTPCGLFEASNGNTYIITSNHVVDGDPIIKIAIALVHRHLMPFTLQFLGEQPLEHGYWHGSYRMRLANALPEECGMGLPGVISLGDQHASIQCWDLDQSIQMVSLGYVGRKGFDFRDFDGWSVLPMRARDAFFQKMPDGKMGLLVRPRIRDEARASISNSLKQMLKEGTVERKLAGPDSSQFSYRLLPSVVRDRSTEQR